jgi:hypothetical protein
MLPAGVLDELKLDYVDCAAYILTKHGPINVKSPNNINKWQMGFNSAFKVLTSMLNKRFAIFMAVKI